MKAVTIAKIARLRVVIAVAVVIAIPTFAGVESMKIRIRLTIRRPEKNRTASSSPLPGLRFLITFALVFLPVF